MYITIVANQRHHRRAAILAFARSITSSTSTLSVTGRRFSSPLAREDVS
jgi:hypothetical protein